MKANCDNKVTRFKTAEANSKAELRRLGIIDRFLNIIDYSKFVRKNREWTDNAKARFDIPGKLFYEENNKALPNKEAFKIIDNSKGIYYQLADDSQIPQELQAQPASDNLQDFSNGLKKSMLNFVKGLNINVLENGDWLLDNKVEFKGVNSAFDTLQKFLALRSDISNREVTLQTANILYTFLGKKSTLSNNLWKNIDKWSGYENIYNQYINEKETEVDIEESFDGIDENLNVFAHKQAIIHFLADALEKGQDVFPQNKRENIDIDKNYFEERGFKSPYEENVILKLFNEIWNFVNEKILGNKKFDDISESDLMDIAMDIVDDVYKEDFSKFIRAYSKQEDGSVQDKKGTQYEKKEYEATLNKDPFAKTFIEYLFRHPFIDYKLSGSQVIRKYGVLLRSINEDLHDIDGVITLEQFNKEENSAEFTNWINTRGLQLMQSNRKKFYKEASKFIFEQSWAQNIANKYPSFRITNAFIGKDHKAGESITVTGYIENTSDTEVITEDNLKGRPKSDIGKTLPKRYVLDFFLRTKEGNYPEIYDNYWKDWKQIFEAKLKMGRAKDLNDMIFFTPFQKDINKFTNKGFRYFTFKGDTAINSTANKNNSSQNFYQTNQNSISYYEGNIEPEPNTIFVFGSNPEGRHGAGAAKVAREQFGAKYGQGEGLQGSAYALPTKDLRVKNNNSLRSIDEKTIISSIRKLYQVAKQNPTKKFKIGYRNTTDRSLNGYTGLEMIEMFNQAGITPSNIVFSKEWADTGKLKSQNQTQNQLTSSPSTPAPAPLIAKVREILKAKGVSVQSLLDYAKAHPDVNLKDVNALADLTNGLIAISMGKQDVALTEEFVHIATALIEMHTPKVMTELIKDIDRYKVFKDTLARYKNIKEYQLSDGKPNIRKIKKEAIDIALREIIVNGNRESSMYPDLFEEADKNFFERMWDNILDFIRNTFGKDYKLDRIENFEKVASQIIEGNIPGQASDLSGGLFFQLKPEVKTQIDEKFEAYKQMNEDTQLIDVDPDDRHYIYQKVRRVAQSVTEKVKAKFNKKYETTEAQQFLYDEKRNWGTKGHDFLKDYFLLNLIDENGYALKKKAFNAVKTDIPKAMQKALSQFAEELIATYPEGTRFLVENRVINTSVKNLIASTTDFKAIYPAKNKKGEDIYKVDTLDWKFYSVDKNSNQDISFFKQDEWVAQMGEYVKIDRNIGVETQNMGRYRMVPFLMNYRYSTALKDKNKTFALFDSIEIGNVDPNKEPSLFLMPVPSPAESTNIDALDDMLTSLRSYYAKLKSLSYKGNKPQNVQELERISAAIRNLHVKKNFEPLYLVIKTFVNRAEGFLENIKGKKFEDMTEAERNNVLSYLRQYRENAENFADVKDLFLKIFDKKGLSPENKKTLKLLERASTSSEKIANAIMEKQEEFTIYQAVSEELIQPGEEQDILAAELPISDFVKSFVESSKLPAKLVNLVVNMILKANSAISIASSKHITKYYELLNKFEKAVGSSEKAFSTIAGEYNGEYQLHRKFSKEFFEKINKAKQEKDRNFLLSNVDITEFDKLVNAHLANEFAVIDSTEYSSLEDPQERAIENDKYRVQRKEFIRKQLNLKSTAFKGYESKVFGAIYLQSLKDNSANYSKEYNNIKSIPEALDVWNYFIELNKKGKDIGYLEGKSMYFFPLVEASTARKVLQADSKIGQVARSIGDLFMANIDESHNFGRVDPTTGLPKKSVPKYFTKTNKKLSELSRDLNRIGPLWIESILQYETSINMEESLNAILAVEKVKGSLARGQDGKIIMKNNTDFLVNPDVNSNADLLQIIVDEFLYKQNLDLSVLGNVNVTKVVKTITPEFLQDKVINEDGITVVNTRKVLGNLDAWTRALGVGWSYAIATANFVGGNLHAFILGGQLYSFQDFLKYEMESLTPVKFSPVKQALLNLIVPINEDTRQRIERENLLKQGKVSAYINTYSFTDFMMWTNAYPDSRIQLANALAIMENSMIRDGKIVNIRQYLAKQDAAVKYDMSYADRIALEKTYESRVKQLKESENIFLVSTIENGEVIIPGVDIKEIVKFRTKIIEFARKLNGQMSRENRMGFARSGIFKSFMMFKTWMPKLLGERILDINKNIQTEQWEYGRMRIFFKTLGMMISEKSLLITDIISGNEKGLEHLRKMLEEKKIEYKNATGKELRISETEYFDLVRRELSAQVRELGTLVMLTALVLGSAALEPPEDATTEEKNALRAITGQIYRIYEEVSFYYNPLNFKAMTEGSIMPSLGTIVRVSKIPIQITKEVFGDADKAFPIKATINVTPVANRFFRDFITIASPEVAKELGIRQTTRRRE